MLTTVYATKRLVLVSHLKGIILGRCRLTLADERGQLQERFEKVA
jgi:hypothetical protein